MSTSRISSAHAAFDAAGPSPTCLDLGTLEALHAEYPSPPPYGYDPDSLEQRGATRAAWLERFRASSEAGNCLELGCWDGMVSCCLARAGWAATAVDNRDEGFDVRAREEGVALLRLDAARLPFADDSFDLVFSYDAFEHFAQPQAVFAEMTRVLRPGGHMFINFGPLYYSAMGAHAYRSVTVPYCQCLFDRETLVRFVRDAKLPPISFEQVNGLTPAQYRAIWQSGEGCLHTLDATETQNVAHVDLIERFPSCFRRFGLAFEDFLLSDMEITFQKR